MQLIFYGAGIVDAVVNDVINNTVLFINEVVINNAVDNLSIFQFQLKKGSSINFLGVLRL